MTNKEAIYILRNAAWLGSDADRQKVEEAVEVVANAIEAQDMILYMNLPEVSAEEAVEILKRNNRIELLPPAQPEFPIKEKCAYCPHCENCDVNDDLTITQPEREKGKWIPISDGYVDIYECNQCGDTEDYERNFCPDCGADMR